MYYSGIFSEGLEKITYHPITVFVSAADIPNQDLYHTQYACYTFCRVVGNEARKSTKLLVGNECVCVYGRQ
jgi:hypothetical protein